MAPAAAALPVRRLLLDVNGYLPRTLFEDAEEYWTPRLEASRARLAAAGCPVPGSKPSPATIGPAACSRRSDRAAPYRTTASDRIDRVLTHRLWGTLGFRGGDADRLSVGLRLGAAGDD